ncbi:mevalonate kinase [Listeria cossartiae subsp. cayugensis]|uniref:mevalonate kinase n=1 Tax=Listeria TaxID=1637 RepID=UPI00288026D7|nr:MULTISPECIES: mevalonate kinase [Listeria]MDT0000801.1 mevalonate kinase [Listeria cossartiae subsp. cayugensis]MDT0004093.1 mevalonate kinase [Listeria cossartiae subsp. cayugensis]MDT0009095.1 mevalonate kinase [Listeria cossartiae subsp. cayugensis]MDT0020487.1 mevalonate kinase [Listeria cossartiae subsp. cayugensis]MDT0030927.1 mevalonate kinase [Listeria cossartiae subsp. cayugensis]
MATGIGTAKMILCGEHAVVYGEPAISVPFTQAIVTTNVETSTKTKFSSAFFTGDLEDMPDFLAGIKALVVDVLNEIGKGECVSIHVNSGVPIGRGLGSSAAVATSIARGLYKYFNQELDSKKLLAIVNAAEKIAHGNASGVDAITVVSEKPVWYERDRKLEIMSFPKKITFVVADTGVPSETRDAVKDVQVLYKENEAEIGKIIKQLGDISREIKTHLEGDADTVKIGAAMNQAQTYLETLTVSDSSLEKLIKVARSSGADGAKLTGGGRGGCIIAVAKNQEIAEKITKALHDAGAAQEWIFTIGEGSYESDSHRTHECGAN